MKLDLHGLVSFPFLESAAYSPLDDLFPVVLGNLEQRIRRLIPSGFRVKGGDFVRDLSDLTADVRFQLVHSIVKGKDELLVVRKKDKKDHIQLTMKGVDAAKRLRDGQAKELYTGDLYTNISSVRKANSLKLLMDIR